MKITWIPTPPNWKDLKFHPFACAIGFGEGGEMLRGLGLVMDALAAHMRRNGYDEKESITVYRSSPKVPWEILSGRHRRSGAIMANVTPTFQALEGTEEEAREYAMKDALRRHLTQSQRAFLIVQLSHTDPANLQYVAPSQEEMAKKGHVSERLIADASKVEKQGTEKLKDAVRGNLISVPDAAQVADLPDKVQDAAVQEVKTGQSKTARKSKAATAREPGDDTDAESEAKRNARKNGKPLFDWRAFNDVFGKLVRQIDTLGGAYKCNNGPEAEGLRRRLAEWQKDFKAWHKKVAK